MTLGMNQVNALLNPGLPVRGFGALGDCPESRARLSGRLYMLESRLRTLRKSPPSPAEATRELNSIAAEKSKLQACHVTMGDTVKYAWHQKRLFALGNEILVEKNKVSRETITKFKEPPPTTWDITKDTFRIASADATEGRSGDCASYDLPCRMGQFWDSNKWKILGVGLLGLGVYAFAGGLGSSIVSALAGRKR